MNICISRSRPLLATQRHFRIPSLSSHIQTPFRKHAHAATMSTLEQVLRSAHKISLDAQQELIHEPAPIAAALTHSAAEGLPPIAIAPAQGASLSILCQIMSATRILEIGTLGGYSTLWFATSSPAARVTSLEINAKHRDVALQNIQNAGQADKVEVILGSALDTLPKLQQAGQSFDFVFIDADWDEQEEYFDWAVRLTRKGGCIYVDNVFRQIWESELEGDRARGRKLVEAVAKDDRVMATMMPTLQTHKQDLRAVVDGYVLAVVK